MATKQPGQQLCGGIPPPPPRGVPPRRHNPLINPPCPPLPPCRRPPAPRPRPDPEMDRALFSRGMAFIQAGMPPADVAALTQARAFLASFP